MKRNFTTFLGVLEDQNREQDAGDSERVGFSSRALHLGS